MNVSLKKKTFLKRLQGKQIYRKQLAGLKFEKKEYKIKFRNANKKRIKICKKTTQPKPFIQQDSILMILNTKIRANILLNF